jgi:precorrin-6B methylase 2
MRVGSSEAFWENFASQLYGGTRVPRVADIIGSLWEMCGLQIGSMVADICCGRGYSSVELAMRGAKVVAVDLSPEFIENLRGAAKALNLDIVAYAGGAQGLQLAEPACTSMILWNSLGHQDSETDLEILANARKSTHAGGSLVLELATLEELARKPNKVTTRDAGESKIFRRTRSLDTQTGKLLGVWEVLDENGTMVQEGSFSQTVYPKAEIVHMMERTGWSYVTDSDNTPVACEPTGTLFIGRAATDSGRNDCLRCRGLAIGA